MLLKLSALLLLGATYAWTQSITVQNPSFETASLAENIGTGPFSNLVPGSTVLPVGGSLANWTVTSTTVSAWAGAWDPFGAPSSSSNWWSGTNVGYIGIVGPGTVALSQTLPATLQSNTTYTLSALVGGSAGVDAFNYAIQLWAGQTLLGFSSKLTGTPNFASGMDSFAYSSGPNNPNAGQPLVIVLSANGKSQVTTTATFDNISLTASSGSTSYVLPQLAFGGGWYTAIYFTNTNNAPVSFPVNFVADDGTPLAINAVGGASTAVSVGARGSALVEIPNAGALQDGYISFSLPGGVTGYGIFRSSAAGRNDQEAVVPLSGVTATTSSLIYDDTNYITGVAVVNLSSSSAIITATAHDSQGNNIGTASIPLPPNGKTAVILRNLSGLAGVSGTFGSVDFTSSGGSLAALGLRFNGTAFTSIPTLDR